MMQIERIISAEVAASILALDDPRLKSQVLDRLECSKAEWTQGIVKLLSLFEGNFVHMWGIKEGEEVKAYLLAVNAVQPPFSRSVMIMYQNFFGMTDEEGEPYHEKLLQEVKSWARELGVNRICIVTDYPHVNSRFGFVEEGHSMSMEVQDR